MGLVAVVDLWRVGASWTGKIGGHFRTMVLAVAVSFTGDISIAQDFDKSIAAYDNGDYQAAFQELLPLADKGNASAQSNLGDMYENGEGVNANASETVPWYRFAADQSNAMAQNILGLMYEGGKSIIEDAINVSMWFNIAGENEEEGARKKRAKVEDAKRQQIFPKP